MQLRNENSYGRLKDAFDWNLVDATPSLQTLTGTMVLKVVSLHLNISRAPGNAKPELLSFIAFWHLTAMKLLDIQLQPPLWWRTDKSNTSVFGWQPKTPCTSAVPGPSQHINTAAARPKKQRSNTISTINQLTKLFTCDRNKPLSVITKLRSKPAASLIQTCRSVKLYKKGKSNP